MAWKQYDGPSQNLSQIDLENQAPTFLWPNTYVDGDGCQLPGFGDIDRKCGVLATIVEPGHMARFNVEKNKLFTIRLVLSQGVALGYGTYSACEIVYSFVPTSDRYTIASRMSEDKKHVSRR